MCNELGDYLLTYDLQFMEEHSDSSDFEGNPSSLITLKNGNHRIIKKKLFSKSKKNLGLQPCSSRAYPATDESSTEMWESQTIVSQNGELQVHQSYQNRKSKTLDDGDQIETIKSKRSLIRHKVIPCLSSMFGRSSNNFKQMSIIKENPTENNSCQANRVNCEHKIRKFNRRQQCYAVQPVYAVEGNIHAKSSPFQRTKILQEPLSPRRTVGNENSNNNSLTSSTEAIETRRFLKKKKIKVNKSKHKEPEMGQEYLDHYEGSKLKHREQQCPSKLSRKVPYQVYTNPCQYNRMSTGCSPISSNRKCSGSELPATCSGFWDYLFNKINMKYQAQAAAGLFKPCKCNDSIVESPRCGPATCQNTPHSLSCQVTQPCYISPCPATRQESCSCNTSHPQVNPLNQNENEPQRPSPTIPPVKLKNPQDKVECKCPRKKLPPPPLSQATSPRIPSGPTMPSGPMMPSGPVVPMPTNEPLRPCQLTHEEITETLTQKYNGEILCIHNPPCVLINGCLNLPPPKEELTMDTWPVTQSNKSGYHQLCNQKCSRKQQSAQYVLPERHPSPIMDVSCQYFPPDKEVPRNESCQYQFPSMELKRMLITDEGCQYQYSPIDIRQQQITANNSCQYRSSPLEVRKQIAYTNECCQYSLSPPGIQQQLPTKDTYQYLDQYLDPTVEVRQLKAPPKKEKIIQSICNHNPPCEVIRTCCKTKFDPKLQNSCVHVPMCEKVPLCLMELKSQNQTITSCQHKPKCAEVPICTRNYIVLTAKEEVATQVRPKAKMVCRHEPPCIMIPRCLAHRCESYIPYDAIPDCVHQPMCEMIPACCRKSAKEMVSVCSQYPNQCCLV